MSIQRGEKRWMSQPTTGIRRNAGPWMKTKSTAIIQVSTPPSAPTATLVEKAIARNANMPVTATMLVIA